MMRKSVIPLGILLSFLLSVTGVAVAAARALPQGDRLVLCSGLSVVMESAGANPGDPASLHLCPDGALLLFTTVPLPEARALPPDTGARRLEVPDVVASCPVDVPSARARAPPMAV